MPRTAPSKPAPKSRAATPGELTAGEFKVIAKIMQSEPPAKDAAYLVLVEGKAIKDAVLATGMLQPAVSRTVKRYRDWNKTVLTGYARCK